MMKNTKNVLITTLSRTNDFLEVSYYNFRDELDRLQFCTGISNAEAGTKYMLSQHHIDHIYILGPKGVIKNANSRMMIKNAEMPVIVDKNNVDEFEFYCYRIAQYLSHIDIEANDILCDCDQERRKELATNIQNMVPKRWEGAFYTLATDSAAFKVYSDLMEVGASGPDRRIAKYDLYTQMDRLFKMHPLDINSEITVEYIGIDQLENRELSSDGLFRTLNECFVDPDTYYNLHIDLQGMNKGDSISIWNILTMFQSINNTVSLQSVICTQGRDDGFTRDIYNEEESYNLTLLLSGIKAFLYYGKTEQLADYYRKNSITNEHLMKLLTAMKYVDTGVSLNNINDLTYGIKMIRILLSQRCEDMAPRDRFIFYLMSNMIREDYGPMLLSETLELLDMISWTLKKGFYQQSLTMVEALVPGDLVRKGIYYYARTQEDVEKMKELLNLHYWNDMPKNRYVYQDIDHYFVKSYGREIIGGLPKDKWPSEFAKTKVRLIHEDFEGYNRAYSNIDNDEMLYELLLNYYNIGVLRNSISHAETKSRNLTDLSEIEDNNRLEQVTKALSVFLGVYRSACKLAAQKTDAPRPLPITAQEFRYYTKAHRLTELPVVYETGVREQNVECHYNGNAINIRIRLREIEESPEDE